VIWRRVGDDWVNENHRNLYRGVSGFLCCPGPSLVGGNYGGWGRVIMTVTTAYPTVTDPDIWFGTDNPDCFSRALWGNPRIAKFNRMVKAEKLAEGRPLYTVANMHFCEDTVFDLTELPISEKFCWLRATFWYPIKYALLTGMRTLYLAGCDFSNTSRHYCHGKQLPAELARRNGILYGKIYADLVQMVPILAAAGLELRSVTPNSPINNCMPEDSLHEVLRDLEIAEPSTTVLDFKHSQERQ